MQHSYRTIGLVLATFLAAAPAAAVDVNPFAQSGPRLVAAADQASASKCGVGKCGAAMGMEDSKASPKPKSKDKAGEAKCGQGKCGGSAKPDAAAGSGKCGGAQK